MRHAGASAMFDGARFDTPAPSKGLTWGCGDGTFTLALTERLAQGTETRFAAFAHQRAALYAALCER